MSEVGGAAGANVGVEKPDGTKPDYGFDNETPPNV